MLKVFQRIRRNLLSQNKFTNYFFYAIGEILLVVVGILIALQVSDWNEHRKFRNQEVKILKQLNSDLEANAFEIDGLNKIQINRLRMCDSILDYLRDRRAFDDSLKKYFEAINIDGLFNCSNTTYKYIQNQGVNFLSNDSLRIKVTQMYELDFQNIFSREELSWQIMHTDLRPAYDRLFKATLATNQKDDNYLVNTPKDMEALYGDEAFKNVVVRMRAILVIRVRWASQTLVELNQLIEEVDEEIKRLSD